MTKQKGVGRCVVEATKAGEAAYAFRITEGSGKDKPNLDDRALTGPLMLWYGGKRGRSSRTRTGKRIYQRCREQIVAKVKEHRWYGQNWEGRCSYCNGLKLGIEAQKRKQNWIEWQKAVWLTRREGNDKMTDNYETLKTSCWYTNMCTRLKNAASSGTWIVVHCATWRRICFQGNRTVKNIRNFNNRT